MSLIKDAVAFCSSARCVRWHAGNSLIANFSSGIVGDYCEATLRNRSDYCCYEVAYRLDTDDIAVGTGAWCAGRKCVLGREASLKQELQVETCLIEFEMLNALPRICPATQLVRGERHNDLLCSYIAINLPSVICVPLCLSPPLCFPLADPVQKMRYTPLFYAQALTNISRKVPEFLFFGCMCICLLSCLQSQ